MQSNSINKQTSDRTMRLHHFIKICELIKLKCQIMLFERDTLFVPIDLKRGIFKKLVINEERELKCINEIYKVVVTIVQNNAKRVRM